MSTYFNSVYTNTPMLSFPQTLFLNAEKKVKEENYDYGTFMNYWNCIRYIIQFPQCIFQNLLTNSPCKQQPARF